MARLLVFTTTTGYQALQFREAAEEIGVSLVLASNNCHQLDNPWNDGALSVRFHQPMASAAKIREFAQHHSIDGIIAIGDAPTLTAAVTARELGIPFHPPEAVEACRNKFLARERYKARIIKQSVSRSLVRYAAKRVAYENTASAGVPDRIKAA